MQYIIYRMLLVLFRQITVGINVNYLVCTVRMMYGLDYGKEIWAPGPQSEGRLSSSQCTMHIVDHLDGKYFAQSSSLYVILLQLISQTY
jgi:hypothetical protein